MKTKNIKTRINTRSSYNGIRQKVSVLLSIVFMMSFSSLGHAEEQKIDSGDIVDSQRYRAVATPIPVSTGDKIEVAELFWYGCGHCFSIESYIKDWKETLPENVEFVKVPAVFSRRWEFHAKAYYTMQALGLAEKANSAFFKTIHVERKDINNLEQLSAFLSKYDITKQKVEDTFNSFSVANKIRNSKKVTQASGATGVPAFIIDGKYLTSVSLNGNEKRLFETINKLIKKAELER